MRIPIEILEEFWVSINLCIVLLFTIFIFACKGTTLVFFNMYLPSTTFSHIEQVKEE